MCNYLVKSSRDVPGLHPSKVPRLAGYPRNGSGRRPSQPFATCTASVKARASFGSHTHTHISTDTWTAPLLHCTNAGAVLWCAALRTRGRILFSGQCLGSDKTGRVAAVFCLGTWRFGGFSIGIGTKPAPKPGEQCLASHISPQEECLGNGQNGQLMSGDIKIGALLRTPRRATTCSRPYNHPHRPHVVRPRKHLPSIVQYPQPP